MAKHLMSFLGTTEYKETDYYAGDISNHKSSKYILDALIDVVCKEWDWKNDKISVFLTDKARENNWEKEGTLKDILISRGLDKNIFGVDIVAGGSENEIWQMFEQMTEAIGEGDELYIDITNSFRFVPLLMTSVAIFAKTVKNAEVKAVYYGAFVPGENKTPILNIAGFVDVIDWSQGSQLFVKTGNIEAINNSALATLGEHKNEGAEMERMMKNLLDMMNGLDNSQGVGTTGEDEEKITILNAYKDYEYNKVLFISKYKNDIKMAPVYKVLKVIDEDVEIFRNAARLDSNFLMGMCAVSWYIRKGKAQQGFTALDETMKTYVCQRYGIDEIDYSVREDTVQKLCRYLNRALDRGTSKPEKERREKAYKKWINDIWKEDVLRDWKMSRSEEKNANVPYTSKNDSLSTVKENQNLIDFLDELSYGIETEELIKKYFSENIYHAWKEKKHGGSKGKVNIEKNKEKLWDLFENGVVEKIFYGLSHEFTKLKLTVGDQRNSMNHFGYTDKKLSEKPLKDLTNHFANFVTIVEKENGGQYVKTDDDGIVTNLSEDILKELRALVEEAKKFVEI